MRIHMTRQVRAIVEHIAAGWSREKDSAQPKGLEFDIQFALGCSWGRALTLANWVRCRWPVAV